MRILEKFRSTLWYSIMAVKIQQLMPISCEKSWGEAGRVYFSMADVEMRTVKLEDGVPIAGERATPPVYYIEMDNHFDTVTTCESIGYFGESTCGMRLPIYAPIRGWKSCHSTFLICHSRSLSFQGYTGFEFENRTREAFHLVYDAVISGHSVKMSADETTLYANGVPILEGFA